jgi:hypothetical protein
MGSTYTTNLTLRKPDHRDVETLEAWSYVLNSNFDLIDAAYGLRSYTEQNYIVNADSHSSSLNKLDMKLFDVAQLTPTANEKAALVGPTGYAPSAGNPYATVSYVTALAPIARKLILAPEYAGSVLWNGGSSPTGGVLTTDYELVTTYGYNFYKWLSTAVGFEVYNVMVRWKVPETFTGFLATANKALIIDICTDEASTTNNKVGATIFKEGVGTPSPFVAIASTGPGAWCSERTGTDATAIHFDSGDTVLSSLGAGDVLVIQIEMSSKGSSGTDHFVKIGDITIQYTG